MRAGHIIAIFGTSKRARNKRPREYEAPQREYECGRVFRARLRVPKRAFLHEWEFYMWRARISVTEGGGRTVKM